jgi:hypothetical protein
MDTTPDRLRPVAPRSALPVVQASQGPAKPGYQRAIEVALRSVHIVSMALVLGGIGMGGTRETLLGPIVATVATGLLLLAACVRWGCLTFTQGAGWTLILKLGLLGLGNIFEGARLPLYAAATIVTSVGSHMPSTWRHYSLSSASRPPAGSRPPSA